MSNTWNGIELDNGPFKKYGSEPTDEEWEKHFDEQDRLMWEGVPEDQLPTIDIREHEALVYGKRNS